MASNNAAALAEQVRYRAAAAGAHVVMGSVHTGDHIAVPFVHLDPEAALALIEAARPRVLYLEETALDLTLLVDEARATLVLGDADVMPPELDKAIAALKPHEGETCWASVHFVVDAILHSVATATPWLTEFERRLEDLESLAREARENEGRRERVDNQAQIQALAQTLRADPAFHFGKTSTAKRHLLATTMFPDEDSYLLDEVVDLAQRLDWLDQSGINERKPQNI